MKLCKILTQIYVFRWTKQSIVQILKILINHKIINIKLIINYHLKVKNNLTFICKLSMKAIKINHLLGEKIVVKYEIQKTLIIKNWKSAMFYLKTKTDWLQNICQAKIL